MQSKSLLIGLVLGVMGILAMGGVHVGGTGTYQMEVADGEVIIIDTRNAKIEVHPIQDLPGKDQNDRRIRDWK